ncbi:hypothetical protein NDU88_001207 [Pleurodeles waltl]|uniref:EF-hand domain-containing protein n=2 Tax=Pleurodeles waltl TaxID=8319 RepID=A0AAV7L043_PLEWA|nr:hypothetical protein NDU88_001207 [Pleurodeles waltl]
MSCAAGASPGHNARSLTAGVVELLTAFCLQGFARAPSLPTTLSARKARPPPRSEGTMTSQLEDAMQAMITVFHKYSGREGDKYKLSKKELKDLIHNELGGFLETQKDMSSVETVLKELDENGDGEVDFQEFVIMVATLTVACNNFFSEEEEED